MNPTRQPSASAKLILPGLSSLKLAYTSRELCESLGVCRRTLSRLEDRGILRSSKALRTKLYPRTEVERFLRETLL